MEKVNAFGYREELRRSLGGFSSFALSFSLISVLTGIFANFNYGFSLAGGAIVWTWSLVAIGQLLVALVMANLAIRFPIAGYGYQWVARLAGPHFGFFVGWLLLIQFITGFPGICHTFSLTLLQLVNIQVSPFGAAIITTGIIGLVTIVHLFGIRAASFLNDIGVATEIAGVVLLIAILAFAWWIAPFVPADSVFTLPAGTVNAFQALALSMVLGTWCLTGFEAAADLAEETDKPERSVPRAVVLSHISASVSGLVILILLVLQAGEGRTTLLSILHHAVGIRMTNALMIVVLFSILACAVASMATASRLIFSQARDRIFPFSGWLASVSAKRQTPANATLIVCVLSSLAILIIRETEIITAASALASFLGYAGIMLAAMTGSGSPDKTFGYPHGWERVIQATAFCWTLVAIAALAVPPSANEQLGTRHLPAWSACLALAAGTILYFLYVRNKLSAGQAGPPKMKPDQNP